MIAALVAAVMCCAVSGHITSNAGLPISGAQIRAAGSFVFATATRADGSFTMNVPPGHYRISVRAAGFGSMQIDDVAIVRDGETIDASLAPISSEALRTIGEVRVNGQLTVQAGAIPSAIISRQTIELHGLAHLVDAIAMVPTAALTRPDGGNSSAPIVVSLRGPDPSETLVALDGQILNNTNTGDLDVGQLVAAPFGFLDVSEGLGPSDNSGANTIGGEINFASLAPTKESHQFLQSSSGSFGTWSVAGSLQGTVGHLGYALAGNRNGADGFVNNYGATLLTSTGAGTSAQPVVLGSWLNAASGLSNFTYTFSPRADIHVRYLTIQNTRDESAAQNSPATDDVIQAYINGQMASGAPVVAGPYFVGGGPQTAAQNLQAGLADMRLPVGAGTLSVSYAGSSSGLANQGAAETPYDFSNVDRIGTAAAQFEQNFGSTTLTLGDSVRSESLSSPDQFTSTLNERSYAAFGRLELDGAPHLHIGAAVYDTRYSTFGTSIDWRLGATYRLKSGGVARFAVGTGFRAPLLAERFALPNSLLVPDQNCVAANGNPNLQAEHVTEYELGYGQAVGSASTADLTLYRTNLRSPIENFYPLGTTCPSSGSTVVAQSFPVNVGNAVYQGGALALASRFGPFFARLQYAVNQAYPTSLLADFVANPTSGSDLVPNQQFSGIAFQSGLFDVLYSRPSGIHADVFTVYRGRNNELNQGPFAQVGATVGRTLKSGLDISLAGQNLTSAMSGRFTLIGQGIPYPTPAGPIARDALFLEPASVKLVLTYRH